MPGSHKKVRKARPTKNMVPKKSNKKAVRKVLQWTEMQMTEAVNAVKEGRITQRANFMKFHAVLCKIE